MTFYNHIENVRTMAINLTHGEPWHGARDKARVFDSLDAARREYMQLQAENAKLRELVRHMHTCMEHYEPDGSVSCDRCPLDNDTGDCDYEQRMRGLGIEVE